MFVYLLAVRVFRFKVASKKGGWTAGCCGSVIRSAVLVNSDGAGAAM